MSKVKVRVLYPTAFSQVVAAGDEIDIDEATATSLIAEGFAEPVKARLVKNTETADVKLKAGG